MIKVLKPGFYSTIQDAGRFGYRDFGVPVAGAMDSYSSKFSNLLLGNAEDAAVIEITMVGPELQFNIPATMAISGADLEPAVNGVSIEMNKVFSVNIGDKLHFGRLKNGLRAYIAIEGGFNSETILNSQSMYENITGNEKLKKGDTLFYNYSKPQFISHNANVKYDASYINSEILEAYKGPEFDRLTESQKESVLNKNLIISKYNNRMAYQLEPAFKHSSEPILTSPVLPGTVQLTPSGQLIVLMRDGQTTGGYPRVLQLTEKAINTLSQKTTANHIKFRLTE